MKLCGSDNHSITTPQEWRLIEILFFLKDSPTLISIHVSSTSNLWQLTATCNLLFKEGFENEVVLVFLLLTLNIFHTLFSVSIVEFEQVNVSWDRINPLMHNAPYFNNHAAILHTFKVRLAILGC